MCWQLLIEGVETRRMHIEINESEWEACSRREGIAFS